ncbi:hypothetical protein ABFS82_05G076800 [Erythranthe guttata]
MEQREREDFPPKNQPESEASSLGRNLVRQLDLISNVEQPLPPAAPPVVNEGKYAIPKKPRKCKCKESRCLKLYCKCLASGTFCNDSCNCVNCHNNEGNKAARDEAVNAIFERNPELCGRLPLSQF